MDAQKQHTILWMKKRNGIEIFGRKIWRGKLKKYEMHDAYFGILIHDKYLEYVNDLVKTVIDEFYISVDTKSYNPCKDRYNKDLFTFMQNSLRFK